MPDLKQKKLTKLVGLAKKDFNEFVRSKDITFSKPRLIPIQKLGDEMALTSVFLSAVRLVKEFRDSVFSETKMQKGGKVYFYTEFALAEDPESRIDGLILIVKAGKITDAAILEMKNGRSLHEQPQLEKYQNLARKYSIPRIITISNQFVSDSTQSPVKLRPLKSVSMYHFSWTYLLTIAHVLLFKSNISIDDEDQIQIMREVVNYFEHDKSGVVGVNQMSPSWAEVTDKINTGASLKISDPSVYDTSLSWHQEERDMALMLSRVLGVLVQSGQPKYKGKLEQRLKDDCKELATNGTLSSNFRIKDAASDITAIANFEKRTVEMLVSLKAPQDKTTKGQIGWLRRMIEKSQKRNKEKFSALANSILFEPLVKNSRLSHRYSVTQFDQASDDLRLKELREFRIILINDFGRRFSSPKKFVEEIEQMMLDFYSVIVQHLTKWEPPAPKVSTPAVDSNPDNDDN